jgi:hypothetical protein
VLADLSYTLLNKCPPPGDSERLPQWLQVLSHISFVIVTLFLLEIPLALFAFGVKYYNPLGRHPHAVLHLFDALLIITTFVLEAALKGAERELAGLLIILRLWRLVKLIGGEAFTRGSQAKALTSFVSPGIAVGAGELQEETVRQLAETSRELEEARVALHNALNENKDLRSRALRADDGVSGSSVH